MPEMITAMAIAEAEAIDLAEPSSLDISIRSRRAGGVLLVELCMEGADPAVLEVDEARALAEQIDRAVTTAKARYEFTTGRGERRVAVFRRGRGIVLAINGIERTFTVGIASEGVSIGPLIAGGRLVLQRCTYRKE